MVKKNPRKCVEADRKLGERIRLRRVERKMSQEVLGKACGVSFQQIQKLEHGTNRVSVARLQQIAAALDTPMSFFHPDEDKGQDEVQSLLFLDPSFSLRLLRAYSKLENSVQHNFVGLMEAVAK